MRIVDSYNESHLSTFDPLDVDLVGAGQSFTAVKGILNSAKFYLKKVGNPDGSMYAQIWAHAGTFGTSSIATGDDALATSIAIPPSTLTTEFSLNSFIFEEANKISLTNATKYVALLSYNGGTGTDYVAVGADFLDLEHSGNYIYYTDQWRYDAGWDCIFYVYIDDPIGPFPTHLNV
jgi:hypothetical protein